MVIINDLFLILGNILTLVRLIFEAIVKVSFLFIYIIFAIFILMIYSIFFMNFSKNIITSNKRFIIKLKAIYFQTLYNIFNISPIIVFAIIFWYIIFY